MGKELAVEAGRAPCYSPVDAHLSAVREPQSRWSGCLRGLRSGARGAGAPRGCCQPEADDARDCSSGNSGAARRAASPLAAESWDRAAHASRHHARFAKPLCSAVGRRAPSIDGAGAGAATARGPLTPRQRRFETHDGRLRAAGFRRSRTAVAGSLAANGAPEPRRHVGRRQHRRAGSRAAGGAGSGRARWTAAHLA